MEGRDGAAGFGTWICLLTGAAWLTLVTGQRDTNAERNIVVTLAGGISNREGIVELTYQGQRGKLCDIGITTDDVAVLCRMAGFEANGLGTYRLLTNTQEADLFPQVGDELNYILFGLNCNRFIDSTIADCDFEPGVQWFNTPQCIQTQSNVGIQCMGDEIGLPPTPGPTAPPQPAVIPTIPGCTPSPNVRLRDGETNVEGRVEVRRPDGSFGSICDNGWGQRDAQVICRMLCYDPIYAQGRINRFAGNNAPAYYLTEVDCVGTEDDILSCDSDIATPGQCDLRTEAAGVTCFEDLPTQDSPPRPQIECENSRITARFSRELEPDLRVEYLSLQLNVQSDCGYTEAADANFVTISIPFIGCGTEKITNNTHITYRNTVRHSIPPQNSGLITRETTYLIEVTCSIARDGFPERNLEPQGQPAPPAQGTGQFGLSLDLYRSSQFLQPIRTFPARVTLGDWLFVGISLNTQDEALKLVVPSCYATPDADRDSQPQYNLISNKCGVDNSLVFIAFNDTFFAFRYQTFKFVGDRPFVYIHCTSYVCEEDEDDRDCDRSCNNPDNRGKRSVDYKISLNMANNINNDNDGNNTRRRRDVTRSLFPTDRGPIEFLDSSGNLIQLERQLEKPRPILTGSSNGSQLSCRVGLLTMLYAFYHLL